MKSSVKSDRRVDRTRQQLMSAFRELLLERGYARLSVRGIIERANIGRSTFYEHFPNKEQLLYESLAFVLSPLGDAVLADQSEDRLRLVTAHIWDTRKLTGIILLGSSRAVVLRFLADLIEERMLALCAATRTAQPVIPTPLIAAYLAEAQLSLIGAWLSGPAECTPDALAHALAVGTSSAAKALLSAPAGFSAAR